MQAFMLRMENDIAKRDSDKRVNEMRKTADGRRVLRQLGMMPAPPRSVVLGKLGTDLGFSALGILRCADACSDNTLFI